MGISPLSFSGISTYSADFQKILMAMTYFVGEASHEALQKTSGRTERRFSYIMASASDAYIEKTGIGYTVHPLTHAFCRAMLDRPEYNDFRRRSSLRFVEHFSAYTKQACQSGNNEQLELEIRNITVAAKLAAVRTPHDEGGMMTTTPRIQIHC